MNQFYSDLLGSFQIFLFEAMETFQFKKFLAVMYQSQQFC
jgi:hypothetical protein